MNTPVLFGNTRRETHHLMRILADSPRQDPARTRQQLDRFLMQPRGLKRDAEVHASPERAEIFRTLMRTLRANRPASQAVLTRLWDVSFSAWGEQARRSRKANGHPRRFGLLGSLIDNVLVGK